MALRSQSFCFAYGVEEATLHEVVIFACRRRMTRVQGCDDTQRIACCHHLVPLLHRCGIPRTPLHVILKSGGLPLLPLLSREQVLQQKEGRNSRLPLRRLRLLELLLRVGLSRSTVHLLLFLSRQLRRALRHQHRLAPEPRLLARAEQASSVPSEERQVVQPAGQRRNRRLQLVRRLGGEAEW